MTTPTTRRTLTASAHNLTIVEEDYGEHHASAATLHYVLSRPLQGQMRFRTTNGDMALSDDQRYLLIYDWALVLVFDLANETIQHWRAPEHVSVLAAGFDGRTLWLTLNDRIEKHSQRETIALSEISARWASGFGPAAEGDFPTAYPPRPRPGNKTPDADKQTGPPIYTPFEKRLNFMLLNPTYVFLGDGTTFQPKRGYTLPRGAGRHLVGGTVRLNGEAESRLAVFEMDAKAGALARVWVREGTAWVDVSGYVGEKAMNWGF